MLSVFSEIDKKEFASSTIWFEESGLLCSKSKKSEMQSVQDTKEIIDFLDKKLCGEKVCMLADVTYSSETTRDVREYAANELPRFIKALAMLSDSVTGKMLANLFFKLKYQSYPVKMFNHEKDAREWLMKYM
jgi:hypothetical protein